MRKIINLERYIKNKIVREWVEALIFAGIVALIFRTWLYAPFRVPTGSMIPTILIGDQLFADMHAYGFVVPFTDIKLFESDVKRGDIIIFPYPKDPSKDYIKRAIAVEGDVVEFIGETLYINNQSENNPHVFFDSNRQPFRENCQLTVPVHVYPPPINCKFKVPKGKILALGDNRRNSADGRIWGYVDQKNVRGKAKIIYWSHNPAKGLFSGYRFNRIGQLLK